MGGGGGGGGGEGGEGEADFVTADLAQGGPEVWYICKLLIMY